MQGEGLVASSGEGENIDVFESSLGLDIDVENAETDASGDERAATEEAVS